MSAEIFAQALELYQESSPNNAISSQLKYDFASENRSLKRNPWLDVGTNYGHGITASNSPDIKLDVNPHFLSNQTGNKVQANGSFLPFASETMGLVTLFEVIEHASPHDGELMLKEAKRVVKPDGQIIISTPNKGAYGKRMSSPDHIHEYTKDELVVLFSQIGLQIIHDYGQGFITETNLLIKLIKYARDNKFISFIYYHIPLSLRNILRIEIQKTTKSFEIRAPHKNEKVKNFLFVLKPT